MSTQSSIVVTGLGICSALGTSPEATLAALRTGQTRIQSHAPLLGDTPVWAGLLSAEDQAEVDAQACSVNAARFDRTGRLALWAARQALNCAGLTVDAVSSVPDGRLGLVLGTSHGGRSQLDRFVEEGADPGDSLGAQRVLERGAHHNQTAAVAAALRIHGPVLTLSSACGSSGVAIAHGIELLRSGRVDACLVGGADAFSKLTYAGFAALGAMADGPCSPFSEQIGMSLGEGAGMLLLERSDDAERRGANVHLELIGYGLSWDAYHLTQPEPSGAGIARALGRALGRAEVSAEQVDWFHAHGTGTRANDAAECSAIKRCVVEPKTVAAVSTKAYTGHTLGASSAVGFVIAALATDNDFIPPTVGFRGPRSGCDLDAVPNQPRSATTQCFVLNSAAFGGANVSLVAARPMARPARRAEPEDEPIVITGLGVVSALGLGRAAFEAGLYSGQTGLQRLDAGMCPQGTDGLSGGPVKGFQLSKLLPRVNGRRMARAAQFGTVAVHEALANAAFEEARSEELAKRRGLVVGTSRGAVESYARYLESVAGGHWDRASAVHFPNLVMSSIGGTLTTALGLKGIASTVVGGRGCGLAALMHAADLLRRDPEQDCVVVVAADVLEPLFVNLQHTLGDLGRGDILPDLYARRQGEGPGYLRPAEGAVAVVLERASAAQERGARVLGRLLGGAMTHDAEPTLGHEPGGRWLASGVEQALVDAQRRASDISAVIGQGTGDARWDDRECRALSRAFGQGVPPLTSHTGHVGHLEATSGLLSVAAGCMALERQTLFSLLSAGTPSTDLDFVTGAPRAVRLSNLLITASSADGANTALVLGAAT